MAKSLRDWIEVLEANDLLYRVKEEVPIQQLASIIAQNTQKATLFENIADYDMPLVANTFSNRDMMMALGKSARAAAHKLAVATTEQKNKALHAMATEIRKATAEIESANARDLEAAHAKDLKASFIDRLTLNPARIEAEAIALNLRHFGQRFGGNPVGSNAEIVKTLNGGNPQGVRYLPQEYLRLNSAAELLDSFGTPYFFHQNSATEMEIRSAGPDKVMWTPDDIVAK